MRIRKFAIVACAIVTGLVMQKDTCLAVGNEYDTAIEADYGDKFNYVNSNRLPGSPLEAESADGVDTATGHLVLSRNDLYLEGTGGMDFELNRYYDSNEANIGHPTVEVVEELKMETVWVHYTTQEGTEHQIVVHPSILQNHKKALKDLLVTYTKGETKKKVELSSTQRTKIVSNETYNTYGISSGWRFDFPWIETVTIKEESGDGWSAKPAYLHMGSKGTMDIATTADAANKSYTITGLKGYNYSDVKLEDWNQNVDGVTCRYLLRDKTGLRTYFNADGVVVMQKDAHNNTIHYTYQDQIYFDKITDSVGREICFHYNTTENGLKTLDSVTVQGQEIAGGVSKKTVTYTTEEKTYTPLNSEELYGLVLTSATVDGSKETYDYRTVERLVNTAGAGIASQRVSTNESYLLKKTTWDGCEQHYEYRACSIRGPKCESGAEDRDVVVEGFYVTREYSKDAKTGKKTDGIKYDYFQKQDDTLISYADFQESENELWQYGREGLQTVTVVSRFNPNKYKTNGKFYDYTYTTADIDADTLRLSADTEKEVSLYIYNVNKLVKEEVEYGSTRGEVLYNYDQEEQGSLVTTIETKLYEKKKDTNPIVSKEGFTYDEYRNILTRKGPKAYLKKNEGKEERFITTLTYFNTENGYPADASQAYSLCTLQSYDCYSNSSTKLRLESTLAENGIDIASTSEQTKEGVADYIVKSKTDFLYDDAGNEIEAKAYTRYATEQTESFVLYKNAYNSLGQLTQKDIQISSENDPSQNRVYTQEKSVYDSFGNEVSYTDVNGLVTTGVYDEETGEILSIKDAVGTEYESDVEQYISEDGQKSLNVDSYGRSVIEIKDAFGNVVIEKNEAAGTWTESVYDYGDEESDTETENTGELIEERVYTFEPKGDVLNEDSDGKIVPNYDIRGKGDKILNGNRYVYDEQGELIVSASFSGGALDAAHCSSWVLSKETETIKDGCIIETVYTKELNPAHYQAEVSLENYYNAHDQYVLSENVEQSEFDEEGKPVTEINTYTRGKGIKKTAIDYIYDDFDQITKETSVTQKYQDGAWLPATEEQSEYKYDNNGNIVATITKCRNEGEEWEVQKTKSVYDNENNLVESYSPNGIDENYCTKYEYDLLGRKIKTWTPVVKEDGEIQYQLVKTEYDDNSNVVAIEEQLTGDSTSRTEYAYDDREHLVMVKNCLEGEKAQYTQYVYDVEGNKIRQFTGMTEPLELSVLEGTGENSYTYAGKEYSINVTAGNKKDNYSETKYFYNKKNELTSMIDPEGREEHYTYDVYGNQIKTIDKNGNILTQDYDVQGRLVLETATEKETKKKIQHSYEYNSYGELSRRDQTDYAYDDVSGLVTKETHKDIAGKAVEKTYCYDSSDNCTAFRVSVGGDKQLELSYEYDGFSRLSEVMLRENGKDKTIASYEYNQDGSLSSRKISGVDLTSCYQYNYAGALTNLENTVAKKGRISDYKVKYQLNGQKISEEETIQTEENESEKNTSSYTYDRLGRLIKESHTGEDSITYSYDAHNNRKEMRQGNQLISYKYNKNNELLRTNTLNLDNEKNSVTLYQYDANGNQLATTNRYAAEGEPTFDLDVSLGDNRLNENVVNHYDALNQLSKTLTEDKKVSYDYNADGYRTSKTVNGKTTFFIWDGDQIVMELDEKGKVSKRYIRGNNLIFADKGDGTDKTYYVMNPHGDVVQLLNEAGKVIKSYHYDAFGNEENIDKKDTNPYRYSGEYYDKETDTIYLRARYYDPELGRFLSRDTYTGEEDDPLSLHLYTYCANDGVNNVDPSGHVVETLVDIVSLGDSMYTFALRPSWANAGFLLWDTAAVVVPVAPGSYMAKIPREVMQHAGKRTKIAVRSEKISKYTSKIKKGFSSLKSGVESLGRSIKNSKAGRWFSKQTKKLSKELSGIKTKVNSTVGGGGNSPKKPKKTKVAKGSSVTKKVNRPKHVERQVKKLSPEAKKGYDKAIKALESGDTRGLNDHPLSGNRSGQRAIDIKGTGKGRGAGRIIYEYGEGGEINIIEIFTDHKY